MLLFSFVGLLLLRFEAAKLLELLFQLPPLHLVGGGDRHIADNCQPEWLPMLPCDRL